MCSKPSQAKRARHPLTWTSIEQWPAAAVQNEGAHACVRGVVIPKKARTATPHARIADLQLSRALVALTPLPRTLS